MPAASRSRGYNACHSAPAPPRQPHVAARNRNRIRSSEQGARPRTPGQGYRAPRDRGADWIPPQTLWKPVSACAKADTLWPSAGLPELRQRLRYAARTRGCRSRATKWWWFPAASPHLLHDSFARRCGRRSHLSEPCFQSMVDDRLRGRPANPSSCAKTHFGLDVNERIS